MWLNKINVQHQLDEASVWDKLAQQLAQWTKLTVDQLLSWDSATNERLRESYEHAKLTIVNEAKSSKENLKDSFVNEALGAAWELELARLFGLSEDKTEQLMAA